LNDLLQLHLIDLETAVVRIVGSYPEEDVTEAITVDNGLLEEIDSAQKRNKNKENYIS